MSAGLAAAHFPVWLFLARVTKAYIECLKVVQPAVSIGKMESRFLKLAYGVISAVWILWEMSRSFGSIRTVSLLCVIEVGWDVR